MSRKNSHLKIRFLLGFSTLIVGLLGGSIALFEWTERTNVYYLFGEYTRYVLGFGSFAAMIFGTMLINDTWIALRAYNGKLRLPIHKSARQSKITSFIKTETTSEEKR
jgi:hypothetical protein